MHHNNDIASLLNWLDAQQDEMLRLVRRWAQINSGSHNLAGLAQLIADVQGEFESLGGQITLIDLPPAQSIDSAGNVVHQPLGQAIRIVKRPDAPRRVLLNIHLDTVYGPEHPFQQVQRLDDRTLRGPGVADAKGGLVVMLFALRALEQSNLAPQPGWEILLNPDEEIGSPGSGPLLTATAGRHRIALCFEPSLPDGSLVGARKGSGNFTLVVRGRAAHAGRDFHLGRSAIVAVAEFITRLHALSRQLPEGVTINCGRIEGGGAVNVVPDLAIGRFNVRVTEPAQVPVVERSLRELANELNRRDGIRAELHGGMHAPPKTLDPRSLALLEMIRDCGRELNLDLKWQPSGGASDGNRLAAAGLAVVDTMGPRGGSLHSDGEFLLIDTLAERAKLTLLTLVQLARSDAFDLLW